jgi:hypothetical protein
MAEKKQQEAHELPTPQQEVSEPPVPETEHVAILMDTTNRAKEIADSTGAGTLVGVRVGYDLSPDEPGPGMQFARDCGYVEPLDEIQLSEEGELSTDEWQEVVLGPNPNLEEFFMAMGELYQEMAARLNDAARQKRRDIKKDQKLPVGIGGVLEGYSYRLYWISCACGQGTAQRHYWIDPDTASTYWTCPGIAC